jgi:hypothetical protein
MQGKFEEILQREHNKQYNGDGNDCIPVIAPEAASLFYF